MRRRASIAPFVPGHTHRDTHDLEEDSVVPVHEAVAASAFATRVRPANLPVA
jgi:hypothetical protein